MTDAIDTSAADQPPSLTIAKAPTSCRLCSIELNGQESWKTHVKSDKHVYNLRLKVSEPGDAASPPLPPSKKASKTKHTEPSRTQKEYESDADAGPDQDAASDAEHESDDEIEDGPEDGPEDEPAAPDFAPGDCLFCAQESDELDGNMLHMATAHGFSVPFREFLAVDLETVVEYLHFVIFGYRECICCGTRRSTVEGLQQHMIAKGHCKFDVSAETEEFYEMPQSENSVIDQAQPDSSMPVRLPSGKLISHRKNPDAQDPQAKSRPARREMPDKPTNRSLDSFAPRPDTTSSPSLEVAQRGGSGSGSGEIVRSSEAILAAQLSKLRIASDRIQHKEEKRRRWRTERGQNFISLKRFKMDSDDGRMARRF
ncbi:C2H2 type zinc-finger-domain-containing protein [Daldinia sp. FL1419]|nr:C2H2 type zinc-finger-domain-containing protein [Daldinia sp. FL1419]